jgi:hypothetical protein
MLGQCFSPARRAISSATSASTRTALVGLAPPDFHRKMDRDSGEPNNA